MTVAMLAEHVLQSVLDARPVDVADIRAALEGLHEKPEPNALHARVLQLEIVAALAAEVVRADEGASIAQDWNLVLLWDRIEAMKAALAELGN